MLGISVYPEHSNMQDILNYIEKAGKLGFKRIFTCLLSVDKDKNEVISEFKKICDVAHKYNMEVTLDINPSVFDKFNISYNNLEFFKEITADVIRVDEAFNGLKESLMTYNKQGLKIELNSSVGNKYVDLVMSFNPNLKKLITCHNFYPQKYTGLSLEHFNKCNLDMKKHSLNTAAFVSSNNKDTFGPWPVNEGLSTLEMHRDLPISVQVRHLFATRMIDDVIIGNCFATDEELEICSKLDSGILTFDIELAKELTDVERKILYYDDIHIVRGDLNEYVARSSQTRVVYKDADIKEDNTVALKRGDVVILNNKYSKYKGELQIILKDMENDGRRNVIGKIPNIEHILLDYITNWKPFKFLGGN